MPYYSGSICRSNANIDIKIFKYTFKYLIRHQINFFNHLIGLINQNRAIITFFQLEKM